MRSRRALLKERVDVTRAGDGATALHWAADRDSSQVTELSLRAGGSVNATRQSGVTPLWVAAPDRSTAVIGKAVDRRANPNIGSVDR